MRLLSLCMLATACDYQAPLDPNAPPALNSLSGSVLLAADVPTADVLVLLYDAADPPPPAGTGSPLSFATIPASEFTGEGAGVQSAPFHLTRVPDGSFLVVAVMDVDDDFLPLLTSNAGATCGDWAGAHVADLISQEIAPVTVSGGTRIDQVTVLLGRQYTTERPAFSFGDNTALLDFQAFTDLDFDLLSTGIESDLIQIASPAEATEACLTGFLTLVEADAETGEPLPHWVYGSVEVPSGYPEAAILQQVAYAVWPRVFASYTGVGGPPLLPGESWTSEAVHDPDTVTEAWPPNTYFPNSSLNMTFVPAALHTLPDGSQEFVFDREALPRGEWAVTVISPSGQTWTLPNEIAAYPSTSPDFDPLSQGARLYVQ